MQYYRAFVVSGFRNGRREIVTFKFVRHTEVLAGIRYIEVLSYNNYRYYDKVVEEMAKSPPRGSIYTDTIE